MITHERVKELFDYDNGELVWRVTNSTRACAGKKAGTFQRAGYIQIGVDGKLLKRSRLVFLWHHGYLPKIVDHINHNKADDRIENLRDVTAQENAHNSITSYGSSKYRGVVRRDRSDNYHAQITIKGKLKHIGAFPTEEEASRAYEKERERLFPELIIEGTPKYD